MVVHLVLVGKAHVVGHFLHSEASGLQQRSRAQHPAFNDEGERGEADGRLKHLPEIARAQPGSPGEQRQRQFLVQVRLDERSEIGDHGARQYQSLGAGRRSSRRKMGDQKLPDEG